MLQAVWGCRQWASAPFAARLVFWTQNALENWVWLWCCPNLLYIIVDLPGSSLKVFVPIYEQHPISQSSGTIQFSTHYENCKTISKYILTSGGTNYWRTTLRICFVLHHKHPLPIHPLTINQLYLLNFTLALYMQNWLINQYQLRWCIILEVPKIKKKTLTK